MWVKYYLINVKRQSINSDTDDLDIINISNENELRQDYKIEKNKFRHKINNYKVKIPKKLQNKNYMQIYFVQFHAENLELIKKKSDVDFKIISVLESFPEISNAEGKPIILLPLNIVIIVKNIKYFYEDWKRKNLMMKKK